MKLKKIVWKTDTRKYNNGYKGYVGKLWIFSIHYQVLLKEHQDEPYILNSKLPHLILKSYRFKTIKEAKEVATAVMKRFFIEITKE